MDGLQILERTSRRRKNEVLRCALPDLECVLILVAPEATPLQALLSHFWFVGVAILGVAPHFRFACAPVFPTAFIGTEYLMRIHLGGSEVLGAHFVATATKDAHSPMLPSLSWSIPMWCPTSCSTTFLTALLISSFVLLHISMGIWKILMTRGSANARVCQTVIGDPI